MVWTAKRINATLEAAVQKALREEAQRLLDEAKAQSVYLPRIPLLCRVLKRRSTR